MTHSLSESRSTRGARYLALSVVAIAAIGLPALTTLGALVTTDRYIVAEDAVVTEDQYVTATSAIVEGRIDGNLTIFSGDLTISGEVTGTVTVFAAGSVTIAEGGSIGGSLNGTSLSLNVAGTVGSDVFFTAGSVVVEKSGTVQRDAIAFGGTSRFEGVVGRDVRGRTIRTTVDGRIAGDVDVATQSLAVGPTAVIGGDILYRSASDASISSGATIDGTVTKLPAQGNFLYGLILSVANVVGFLGFVVAGLIVFWLLRGTSARAVGSILTRPVASLGAGILAVIVLPALIVMMAITLVGIPLALVLVALAVVLFVVGPAPAVTAVGNRVLMRRGGLFGALIVGAVLWRLGIWLIPYVGAAVYVLGMVWGIGGWVLGAISARRSDPVAVALLPAAMVAREDDVGWEPPLAPGAVVHDESTPPDDALDDRDEEAEQVGESADGETPPDAGQARDTSIAEESVRFDAPESDHDAEVPSTQDDPADADDHEPPRSASERFAALREELTTKGTVEPPISGEGEPGVDDGETPAPDRDDDDGWGLPKR